MAQPTTSSCRSFGAALLCILGLAWGASAQTALPPKESLTLGQRVVDARLIEEDGGSVQVSSLAGKPLIVSPIFTRCEHTCPMHTMSLKKAIEQAGLPGRDFNVLSTSFDVSDTDEDLRRYRERLKLPPDWKLARATSDQLIPFLDSLDFHFISQVEGGFAHPNLVVFLTPGLEVAKYLYGTTYAPDGVSAALEIARGRGSWLRPFAPYVFVVGVLGVLFTSFVILLILNRSRSKEPDAT